MITQEKLDGIKVLFYAPDSLALYGLPYQMRADCGQQPGDLWRAYWDYVPPKPGHYGSKRIDLSNWIALDAWNLMADEKALVAKFLTKYKALGAIPSNPYEWCDLV